MTNNSTDKCQMTSNLQIVDGNPSWQRNKKSGSQRMGDVRGTLEPWNFWFGARSPVISVSIVLILLLALEAGAQTHFMQSGAQCFER